VYCQTVNIASNWKLPVIYLCENNQYGMGMPIKKATNLKKLSYRAKAYNITGLTIDGNDVLGVYETVSKLAADVREGKGPVFLECLTYRVKGHSLRDAQRYRPEGESREWLKNYDPIERFRKYLMDKSILTLEEIDDLEKNVTAQVEAALKFALDSPFPDPAHVMDGIYA
ncbi:MAG: thiamine pyrophosphate-dependent enzyme, partial [Actinobacteria bacterium]|nr:thiamine pyrophosphate-dependent enzyme [Actinomycetota bacterium]